jgi:cyclohexa-1,5-dienecarbonyl-CoA hydratase
VSGLAVERLDELDLLRLTLDFGKGNVLDVAAIEALRAAVHEAAGTPGLRALLIDHAGPHFSFGASVEDHLPERVGDMLPRFHALARETLALDLPLLCAVRGQCLGGGLEVALLADRVVAAPDARFGQPEIRLAVFAPVASALLPHRIGSRRAADLLLSGRSLDAREALDWGLADAIADDPGAACRSWAAEHLLDKSRAALRLATRAARSTWASRFEADLERLERLYLDELMATEDAAEGIRAFLERRQPAWRHR